MVEAFVNKLTLYNDGRAEIEFNFRDEWKKFCFGQQCEKRR